MLNDHIEEININNDVLIMVYVYEFRSYFHYSIAQGRTYGY